MNIVFADSKAKFSNLTEKGWLYFFLTHPQPNNTQAFIKFGATERSIKDRLSNYGSLDMANIYGVKTYCNQVYIREAAMIQVFNLCKDKPDIDIWGHKGNEFLKGNLNMMLKVFLYFSTVSMTIAKAIKSKQQTIKPENLIKWIEDLPSIESYAIDCLSTKKIHLMNPGNDNILNIDVNLNSTQVININKEELYSILSNVENKTVSKEDAYAMIENMILGNSINFSSVLKYYQEFRTDESLKEMLVRLGKIKNILSMMVKVLLQYKDQVRIGNSFKQQFMIIWTEMLKELECQDINESLQEWMAENVIKPIFKVRDIRWILKDFEGYIIRSRLFKIKPSYMTLLSSKVSRDTHLIINKYINYEEMLSSGNYRKMSICDICRSGKTDLIGISFEKGAPFNVRDLPSNQTDELWVALKYSRIDVIKFLCEYEEKEGRPIIFTEEHAKYLRKLGALNCIANLGGGHLDTLRALMPQFLTPQSGMSSFALTTEEKDGVNSPTPVPTLPASRLPDGRPVQKTYEESFRLKIKDQKVTLPEIPRDQFYEKISCGTQLRKINRELLFVDKPVDKTYFKYKNTADSVILFYNKDTDIAKIEPELLELQKRVPQISFGKTTFDPPYYNRKYSNCNGPSTNYNVAFFRNGCSLYHNSDNDSSDFLYRQIQMAFYQITVIPENEEFATLRKKFENVKGDTTMSMTDVKEYVRYTSIKSNPRELYENLTTSILPNDNTNADDYRNIFEETPVTEEEMKTSEMSREDGDYERKQRAQEAAKSLRDPKNPSLLETNDTSESESFMFARTIFSRLKERYGDAVDFVPAENNTTPKTLLCDSSQENNVIDVPDVDPESFNLQEAITKFYEEQKSTNVFTKDTPIEEILSETK